MMPMICLLALALSAPLAPSLTGGIATPPVQGSTTAVIPVVVGSTVDGVSKFAAPRTRPASGLPPARRVRHLHHLAGVPSLTPCRAPPSTREVSIEFGGRGTSSY